MGVGIYRLSHVFVNACLPHLASPVDLPKRCTLFLSSPPSYYHSSSPPPSPSLHHHNHSTSPPSPPPLYHPPPTSPLSASKSAASNRPKPPPSSQPTNPTAKPPWTSGCAAIPYSRLGHSAGRRLRSPRSTTCCCRCDARAGAVGSIWIRSMRTMRSR